MKSNTELVDVIGALYQQAHVEAVIRQSGSKIADLEQVSHRLPKQVGV